MTRLASLADPEFALNFAGGWMEAWNSHDLECALAVCRRLKFVPLLVHAGARSLVIQYESVDGCAIAGLLESDDAGRFAGPPGIIQPGPTLSRPRLQRGRWIPSCQSARRFSKCDMQSHEILREVFQKTSAKQVAADLGLSLSMIYKWAEPDDGTGSGTVNPLDRIESLLRCTSDRRLVQWICQRAGGFFISNPVTTRPHPSFLIPATNEIVQEFADLLAVIATAAADNQINHKEAASIRERWEELKSVTETFVACCEEGNFSALKDRPPGLTSAR